MIGELSFPAWLALMVALVAACVDWYGAARQRMRIEFIAGAVVHLALIASAFLLNPADTTIRWLVVGALVVGMISTMADALELLELGMVLSLGTLLLLIAACMIGWHSWSSSLVLLVVGVLMIAIIGRRIAGQAAVFDSRLELLILASQVALTLLLVIGFGTTNRAVMLGASLLTLSEMYLGWTRFVGHETVASTVIVHLTRQVALASFVISLVTLAKS